MKSQHSKGLSIPQNNGSDHVPQSVFEQQNLSSLFELLVDYYWETDSDYNVSVFANRSGENQAYLSGFPFWQLGGQPTFESGNWERLRSVFNDKKPFTDFPVKQPVPGRGLRFFNLSGVPTFSDQQLFEGYRGLARDITEYASSVQYLSLEKKIHRHLDAATDTDVAAGYIAKLICRNFLWMKGRYWSCDEQQNQFVLRTTYRLIEDGSLDVQAQNWTGDALARECPWLMNAFTGKKMVWLQDANVDNDDLKPRTIVVYPLVSENKVLGAFEFFIGFETAEDDALKDFLAHVGDDFTDFVLHKEALVGIDQHQDRINYLMHHLSSWYWEVDKDYHYSFFSGKAVDLNPELFDRLLGKQPWDLDIKENWDNLQSIFIARASFENHVFEVRLENNRKINVRFSGDPIFDESGEFLGYRGIGQDITRRKEAEKDLQETKTHLEVILDSTDAGIYRLRFIPGQDAMRIAAWDENFARLYGCANPKKATVEDLVTHVHPQDVEAATKKIWESVRRGDSEHQNEYRILLDDGSIRWIFTSAKIQRNESGEPESIAGIVIDITERKKIEESLLEIQQQLRSAIYTSNIGLFRFSYDPDNDESFGESNALVWNFNLAPLFGYSDDDEVQEKNFFAAVHPDDLELSKKIIEENVRNRDPDHKNEYRVVWPDGSIRWIYSRATLFYTDSGKLKDIIGVVVDVTDRKQAEEKIQFLATHDSLTKLTNRNVFGQLLEHEVRVARRNGGIFGIMFIDLDRFKVINDSLGHDAGDQLLVDIAQRLLNTVRKEDIVSRLGGDEFVVLVREIATNHQAANLAQKIIDAISEPVYLQGREYRVTASVGIAMYPEDGEDEQTLMKNADVAMYLAKEEGKNNFQFYSANLRTLSLEKLTLENDLRNALINKQLFLEYQAKMNIGDSTISGVEALIRWNHPQLGLVAPDQFIPLAEESGIIIPIGRWVLETACRQAKAWIDQGLPPVCMAVNLSPRQFSDPNLLVDVSEVLRKTQLKPQLLELEITESMVMNNADRAVTLLKSIKSLGVRLAIDDFGTGYSSLGQLKQFPIDTIKVDKSFIRHIPLDAEDRAITEAIIAMGKSLSLTVVAEGVENLEQQRFLAEHACDQMQGFYFSKPISASDFSDFVKSKQPK